MKRYTFFIIIFGLLLAFSSCKRCKDVKYCEKPETGERYFGMYKPNAYWIYTNKDSSIVDSVYITNFNIEKHKNELDECFEYDIITYNLNSMFMSSKPINVYYSNKEDCETSIFESSIRDTGFTIEAKNYSEQLTSDRKIQFIDSLIIQNNFSYGNVYCINDFIWFAPNYGIIQYITYDNSDTLFLKIFHK